MRNVFAVVMWLFQATRSLPFVTLIAHLSDLHLVEDTYRSRDWSQRMRLSLLGLGRPSGPDVARQRLTEALWSAYRSGAEHLVLTGDLTEDGVPGQFEVLADVLGGSPWKPHQVTVVPGNHDAYERESAFAEALAGPLRAYRSSSEAGALTVLDDLVVVAVSTAIHQPYWRACGRVGGPQLAHIERVLRATRGSERAVALAIHHPPIPWGLRLGWLEGLLDRDALLALLRAYPHAHVLCGHSHVAGDVVVPAEAGLGERSSRARESLPLPLAPRVFMANAVIDHPRPLRLYEASGGALRAVEVADELPLVGRSVDPECLYA